MASETAEASFAFRGAPAAQGAQHERKSTAGGTSRPLPRPWLAAGGRAGQVTVALLATDPLTREGAAAYLRTRREITLLPQDAAATADVVLVLATEVTESTIAAMRRVANQTANPSGRVVLVADEMDRKRLLRTVNAGLFSVLPRKDTDYEQIVRTVLDSRRGRAHMPQPAMGWLIEHITDTQRNVLSPLELTLGGLEDREVAVLRLIADGLDSAEIGAHLKYSERTIKNIVSGMLTRLNLRNRAHAVGYAVRCGALALDDDCLNGA